MLIKVVDGVTIAQMLRRVDSSNAANIDAVLNLELEKGASPILLDFTHTEFLSSAGIRVILKARKYLAAHGGQLALCGLAPILMDILDLTGLVPLLDLYKDRDTALAAIGASGS